ncbi:MAG: hypothetical protein E7648_03650 [Ruminococcaceae bacterium]|nr:hypothetical protein [Oscillospiraceae bacterium]
MESIMKKIIALILASVMMLFSLISCDKKEDKIDLSSIIVAKTEHYEIDGAMYAFFLYDFVGQNSTYLPYYGYNVELSLREQTSACPLAEGKTWFEFFADMANSYINECLSQAEAAYNDSFELKEEEIAEVKNYIKDLQVNALKNGYKNLDELLAVYYIEGVTAETYEKCIMLQQLTYSYMNSRAEDLEYTDADLDKYRLDHPEKFLMIDVIQYSFFAEYDKDATDEEIEAAEADAKERAEAFFGSYKTVDSFKNGIVELEQAAGNTTESASVIISKYLLDAEYYNATNAAEEIYKPYYEWAYSPDRKAGDTYMLEEAYKDGEKYYTVSCMVTPSYYYDYLTKDCRHILFYVDNNETDNDKLEAAKLDAFKKANSILDEFKNGNKTEEDFKALETKCLGDESALEATAYYNVTKGYMVEEFENWIYGERTPGDCEIVETTYGYHIVYFIGDGLPAWKIDAKNGYVSEIMTEYRDGLIEIYKVTYDNNAIKKIP